MSSAKALTAKWKRAEDPPSDYYPVAPAMLKPSAWPGPGAGLPQKQKPSATASVWHYETLKCQTERLHNSRTFIIREYFMRKRFDEASMT